MRLFYMISVGSLTRFVRIDHEAKEFNRLSDRHLRAVNTLYALFT